MTVEDYERLAVEREVCARQLVFVAPWLWSALSRRAGSPWSPVCPSESAAGGSVYHFASSGEFVGVRGLFPGCFSISTSVIVARFPAQWARAPCVGEDAVKFTASRVKRGLPFL